MPALGSFLWVYGDLSAERNAISETELLLFGMGIRTPLTTGLETICATFLWWELFQPIAYKTPACFGRT